MCVELHRLIKAVGFGKMSKALWMQDEVRQASEVGTIIWFSVPACLALGGLAAPEPHWWHEALCQITLPFDGGMPTREASAIAWGRKSGQRAAGSPERVAADEDARSTKKVGRAHPG